MGGSSGGSRATVSDRGEKSATQYRRPLLGLTTDRAPRKRAREKAASRRPRSLTAPEPSPSVPRRTASVHGGPPSMEPWNGLPEPATTSRRNHERQEMESADGAWSAGRGVPR